MYEYVVFIDIPVARKQMGVILQESQWLTLSIKITVRTGEHQS